MSVSIRGITLKSIFKQKCLLLGIVTGETLIFSIQCVSILSLLYGPSMLFVPIYRPVRSLISANGSSFGFCGRKTPSTATTYAGEGRDELDHILKSLARRPLIQLKKHG